MKSELNLKNDAAIARLMSWDPPVVSKIRNRLLPTTPERILQIYDVTGWNIEKIRSLL
jgi:hypothetical protein